MNTSIWAYLFTHYLKKNIYFLNAYLSLKIKRRTPIQKNNMYIILEFSPNFRFNRFNRLNLAFSKS